LKSSNTNGAFKEMAYATHVTTTRMRTARMR
jgi:hypothetical protein